MKLFSGDIIIMKKLHPCGSNEWEIIRAGTEVKMKCKKCGHIVVVPRKKAEKNILEIKT